MSNIRICISDKFTFEYELSLDENTTISSIKENLAKTLMCEPKHIFLACESIQLDDLKTLQELKATMPAGSDIINLAASAILHSEATDGNVAISPLEDLLTPASLLWMEWVRKIKQKKILPLNTLGIDNTLLPDGGSSNRFPTTIETNDLLDCIGQSVNCPILESFKKTWALKSVNPKNIDKPLESLSLPAFERLMELFAIPESHAIFSVEVLVAVKKAKELKESGLITNIAQHVAQALLPLAAKIFADAINSSTMGSARGAFAGFLPSSETEDALFKDGRDGAFLYRFSDSRACKLVVSYLVAPKTQNKPGEAPTKPSVVHSILEVNRFFSGFVLDGVDYECSAQALAHSNSSLKHPCLIATLAVRVGTIEGAKLVAPIKSVPQWVKLNVLMQEGCGEIDLTFNTTAMDAIKKALDNHHPFESKIYATDNADKYKTIFDNNVIAALTPGLDLTTSLQKYNFQAFHGTITYEQTLQRLFGKKSGTYLLRASASQRDSLVLAFVDAAGKVNQTVISPSPYGSGKVTCSGFYFKSLHKFILAYLKDPTSAVDHVASTAGYLEHGLLHYVPDNLVTKPLELDVQPLASVPSGTTLVHDSLPREISGVLGASEAAKAKDDWKLFITKRKAAGATTEKPGAAVTKTAIEISLLMLEFIITNHFPDETTKGLKVNEIADAYKLCYKLRENKNSLDTDAIEYIEKSSINALLYVQKNILSLDESVQINRFIFDAIEERIFKIRDEISSLPTAATATTVSDTEGIIPKHVFPLEGSSSQTAIPNVRIHGMFATPPQATEPVHLPQAIAVAAPAPQVAPSLPSLSGLNIPLESVNLTYPRIQGLRASCAKLASAIDLFEQANEKTALDLASLQKFMKQVKASTIEAIYTLDALETDATASAARADSSTSDPFQAGFSLPLVLAGSREDLVHIELDQDFDFSTLTNQTIHSHLTGREDLRLKGDAPYLLEYALKFKSTSLPEDVITPVEVKLQKIIEQVRKTLFSKDLTLIGLGVLPNPIEVDIKTCIEKRTGVSRHHSLFLAALVGKLVQNNFIPAGKVSHYQAANNLRAHSFALYTEGTGAVKTHFIIDSVLNICEKIQNQLDFNRVVTIYKEKSFPWFLRNFAQDHGFSYIDQKKPVRVLSFDFDGCLFHQKYYAFYHHTDVIKHNLLFLEKIKATNAYYSQVFGIIGSNRQSKALDDYNSHQTGSCFSRMIEVCDYLSHEALVRTKLDMFLMADLYGVANTDETSWEHRAPLEYGTSYKLAMQAQTGQKIRHANYWFDSNKITLIYAQMHKIAYENRGESIVFDFYDDMLTILARLKSFYETHSDLIPHGLTLQLNHYDGDNVTLKATINGSGMIDTNYINTIKEIVKLTLIDMGKVDVPRLIKSLPLEDIDIIINKELKKNPAALTKRVLIPNTLVAENTHAIAPVITTSPTERRAAELPTFFTAAAAATHQNSNLQNDTSLSLSN